MTRLHCHLIGPLLLATAACSGGGEDGNVSGADAGEEQGDAGDPADAGPKAWVCDRSLPFGAPQPLQELYPGSSSQPWISADSLKLTYTFYEYKPNGQSILETRITERQDREDDFQAPRAIVIPNLDEYFTETAMSEDGQWLYFPYQGDVMRAPATADLATFGEAESLELNFPSGTQYPEYPRIVGDTLYLSLRESNWRRSIYAFDLQTGEGQAVLFDAGDIFSYAITPDGLRMYLSFDVGGLEVYSATRASSAQPFSSLVFEDALNFAQEDEGQYRIGAITADDCEIFGGRNDADNDTHLWRSRRGE